MPGDNNLRLVTAADAEEFERNGAVCLRGRFDRRWLECLAEGFERNLADPGPNAVDFTKDGEAGSYWNDQLNWHRIEQFRDFVFGSPAAAIAGQVMGSRQVRLFFEDVLVKQPGTARGAPWHQDQPYYCVAGRKLCSLWLPLSAVPRSACVKFVAGSHRWGKAFTPRQFASGEDYPYRPGTFEPLPDIDGNPEAYEILSWDLEPGDCIVFHMLSLHAAPGTLGLTAPLAVFSTRWLGDDAVYTGPLGPAAPSTGNFPDLKLEPGDPMQGDRFPLVWPDELASVEH